MKPLRRDFQPAARFLGKAELDDGGDVIGLVREQLFEFGHRLLVCAQDRVGAAELPARIALVGCLAESFLQLGHAAIVETGVAVGDLEVALGHLHARVELERPRELVDGLGDEALLVVEDAEVVMRAGVRRIDAAGKGAEDREVAFGDRSR